MLSSLKPGGLSEGLQAIPPTDTLLERERRSLKGREKTLNFASIVMIQGETTFPNLLTRVTSLSLSQSQVGRLPFQIYWESGSTPPTLRYPTSASVLLHFNTFTGLL
jgi:hypothetical protein